MNEINHGLAWNDKYLLGNKQIDEQHKKLFELVGDIVCACESGHDAAKLKETLDFLVDYTVSHFSFEEALQLEYKYPRFDIHKKIHEEFKKTVNELVAKYAKGGSSAQLSSDVNKIIVRWLINHIQREDKLIGDYIKNSTHVNRHSATE